MIQSLMEIDQSVWTSLQKLPTTQSPFWSEKEIKYTVHMSRFAFAITILISVFMIYLQSRVAVIFRKQDIHKDKNSVRSSRIKDLSLLVEAVIYRHTLRKTLARFTWKIIILTEKCDKIGLLVVRSQTERLLGQQISFLGFSTSLYLNK